MLHERLYEGVKMRRARTRTIVQVNRDDHHSLETSQGGPWQPKADGSEKHANRGLKEIDPVSSNPMTTWSFRHQKPRMVQLIKKKRMPNQHATFLNSMNASMPDNNMLVHTRSESSLAFIVAKSIGCVMISW